MENALCKLTDSLSYSKSRDAIASKKGLGISNVLISINHEHPKQKNIFFTVILSDLEVEGTSTINPSHNSMNILFALIFRVN